MGRCTCTNNTCTCRYITYITYNYYMYMYMFANVLWEQEVVCRHYSPSLLGLLSLVSLARWSGLITLVHQRLKPTVCTCTITHCYHKPKPCLSGQWRTATKSVHTFLLSGYVLLCLSNYSGLMECHLCLCAFPCCFYLCTLSLSFLNRIYQSWERLRH